MLELLSKLKHECQSKGIELLNAQINGSSIKLSCSVNGRRDTELNAYITPDGDSFNFYTLKPQGHKSEVVSIKENEIIPTLVASVNPSSSHEKAIEIPRSDENLVDILKIEVQEGVYDESEVAHNSHRNSRFAYSTKYGKMGTIVDITTRQTNSKGNVDVRYSAYGIKLKDIPKSEADRVMSEMKSNGKEEDCKWNSAETVLTCGLSTTALWDLWKKYKGTEHLIIPKKVSNNDSPYGFEAEFKRRLELNCDSMKNSKEFKIAR